MKRICVLLLALCLLIPSSALAADDLTGRPIADGTVGAVEFIDVTAPFSGTLASFSLEVGDVVHAGDTLLSFVPTGVFAPEDGIVRAMFVSVGDSADAVSARYGAALGIEPAYALLLNATTAEAYDDMAHKRLQLGETLYFRAGDTDGEARVIRVSGGSYQAEVVAGEFELGRSVYLYRDSKRSADECVGRGVVARRDDAMVAASGRVLSLHVSEGDAVKSGQLLMEVVSADAEPNVRAAEASCPADGVVTTIAVQPGQQVWKGQLLCRVSLTSALEVVASVDETALGSLRVGDKLPITLDMDADRVLEGVITEISALGSTRQNAAYFAVHLSIPPESGLLGASASVYLPLHNV